MKVYITQDAPHKLVDAVLSVNEPSMWSRLDTHREHVRQDLMAHFCSIFRCHSLSIRFSDECTVCGWVKLPSSERDRADIYTGHCPNPKCSDGFPPNLADLMKMYPPKGGEPACEYLDKLTRIWRNQESAE